jgi:hypothetical protein
MANLPTTLIRLQKPDGSYVFISHIQWESGRFFPKEETRENPSLETYQLSGIIPPIAYPLVLGHLLLAHLYQNLLAARYRRQMSVNVIHSDVAAEFADFSDTLEEILETFYFNFNFNFNFQPGQGTGPFITPEGEISSWVPYVGQTEAFIQKFNNIFPNTGNYTDTVHVSEALAHLFYRLNQHFRLRTNMEKWDELTKRNFMQKPHTKEIQQYLRTCLGPDGAENTLDKLTDALSGNPNIDGLGTNGFELLENLVDRAARAHDHTERHEMDSAFWQALSRAATNTNTPMSTIEDVINLDREWATNNRKAAFELGQELRDLRNRDREAFEIPYRSLVTMKPQVHRTFQQVIFQPHYKDPSLGLREHGVYWFPSGLIIPWATLGFGISMLNALGIPIIHFGREQAPGQARPVRVRDRAGQGNREIHPFPLFIDEVFAQIYERFNQLSGQVGQTGNQVRENIQRRQGLLTSLGLGGLLFVFGQNPAFYPFIVTQFGRIIGPVNRERFVKALKAVMKYLGQIP